MWEAWEKGCSDEKYTERERERGDKNEWLMAERVKTRGQLSESTRDIERVREKVGEP